LLSPPLQLGGVSPGRKLLQITGDVEVRFVYLLTGVLVMIKGLIVITIYHVLMLYECMATIGMVTRQCLSVFV
jgi:hypothetical protein